MGRPRGPAKPKPLRQLQAEHGIGINGPRHRPAVSLPDDLLARLGAAAMSLLQEYPIPVGGPEKADDMMALARIVEHGYHEPLGKALHDLLTARMFVEDSKYEKEAGRWGAKIEDGLLTLGRHAPLIDQALLKFFSQTGQVECDLDQVKLLLAASSVLARQQPDLVERIKVLDRVLRGYCRIETSVS